MSWPVIVPRSNAAASVDNALGGRTRRWRVFEIVQRLTGRRPPLRIPFPVADLLGAAEELRVTLFGGTPLLTRGAVDIFRHDWSLDSTEAVRELGYTMTPLEDGVARTVSSIRGGRRPERPGS